MEPIEGFNDTELVRQHELQNHIMDTHEDFEALRGTPNKNATLIKPKVKRKPIQTPMKAISKIMHTETDPRDITIKPIAAACMRPL